MKNLIHKACAIGVIYAITTITAKAQTPDANGIVYVNINVSGGNGSGDSWPNATTNLQSAINANGTQRVFVAIGTYDVPSPSSFVMKEGVKIYGGFDPDNDIKELSHARIMPNAANLQGSILNGKNERPIIWNFDNGLTSAAILDGFTLTKGKSTTASSGGCIYNRNVSPILSNLVIKDNTAVNGSALYNESSGALLLNVAIVGNKATNNGGAIYNYSGNPVLTNVTIARNTAITGSAIYVVGGAPQLNNAIVFGSISGNYTSQYSFIEGNISTTNNNLNATGILSAHVFVNPASGNYNLVSGSVAIDKGNNTLFSGLSGDTKDLAGHPRNAGSKIDLGAYEFFAPTPDAKGIVYVRTTGIGSGKSWADATGDLHAAVSAMGTQQVWVEKGIYEVSGSSFVMKNGVAIYGGFDPNNGIDDLLDARIIAAKGSVIEGSVLSGRNERPVIWNYASSDNPINATAILNGFTLTAGAGGGANSNGGAMYNSYASPTLSNLVIKNNKGNKGAGMYNENHSAPLLTYCVFFDNQTYNLGSGGAMANDNSNPKLVNCLMYNNTAYLGGAICNLINAYPNLINCTLANNHADGYGGAMNSMAYSNPSFANCIVYGNTANKGDNGIVKDVSVANPLDFFNASLIQGATNFDDNDNIYFAGPITDIFNDPANNDYALKVGGPAINMGRNIYPNGEGITIDLLGSPRIQGSSVDLGVYEADACAVTSILYVDATVNGNGSGPIWLTPTTGNGASWATAYKTLKDALDLASQCTNVTEIRVAAGTYYPSGAGLYANQQDKTFAITRSNLKITGGYNATTGIRDIMANPTILNGSTDLNYHIMVLADVPLTDSLIIDGFTLLGANANGSGTVSVNGQNISRNTGAGMYMINVGNNVVVRNCTFSSNSATLGAAMFMSNANAVIQSCSIKNNTATQNGGGVYLENSGTIFGNTAITNNTAVSGSGLYYNSTAQNSVFTNVTIAGNAVNAVNVAAGNPQFNNAIVWGGISGTYTAQYTLIEASTNTDNGNISAGVWAATHIFANPSSGDYTLKSSSPAINVGSNTLSLPFLGGAGGFDLAGNPRIYKYANSGIIDLGAYEYQGNPPVLPVTLVSYTAKADGPYAKLQWQITNEVNNKGFEIWRSEGLKGKEQEDLGFVKIGEVCSGGNNSSNGSSQRSSIPQTSIFYIFTDKNPANGNNYYKLVQIDNDGKTTDLGVTTVTFRFEFPTFNLYPNPTVNQLTVAFEVAKFSQLELVDLSGKVLQRIAIKVNESCKQVSLGGYPAGMYIVALSGKGQYQSRRIIKR
ncbi:T9SS type A sorting domain-containing protein [Pedobacter sp. UBA4863]|uniref:T9SS type A sorting domain-containing protein n=1 Tax=Pedobacter sp. UBA4863 TaxID=1947060 RepID=UPI0025D09470|nr:T9SS type A sorting domain-containing protein [Pedobacter sp. UBA4863]